MAPSLVWLAALTACGASLRADERVDLRLDTSQAEAVLRMAARRAAGGPVAEADWRKLFATEPYVRLKRREAEMERAFTDDDFRQFVLSDAVLGARVDLERTLEAWTRADLEAAARRVLVYLPPQARIRAAVFPVIKPRTNSFVFEAQTDPAIFLHLDPALSAAQFENTVAHELHHIGLASVAGEMKAAVDGLPAGARKAAEWMGAFGEGMAMLAAAGGPQAHPHAHSPPDTRARWDRDLGSFGRDVRLVEAFFMDVVEGRLADDARIRERAFGFFGEQGPWYTVGWKMAALVEERYGRAALVECMLDPRKLLATYNRAAGASGGLDPLPLWSDRLLKAVGASAAGAVTRQSGACGRGRELGMRAVYWGPGGIEQITPADASRLRAEFQKADTARGEN